MVLPDGLVEKLQEASQEITDAVAAIEELTETISVEIWADKIEEFVGAKTGNSAKGQQAKNQFLVLFD